MSEIGLNLWLLLLLLMLCLFCFFDAMVGKEFVKGEEIAERKTSGTNQSLSTKICINSRRRREKFEDERKSYPPFLFSLWLLANVRERVEKDKNGLKRDSDDWRFLSEPLLDEEHELLFALVGHFHVFNELTELHQTVVSQKKCLTSFGQKVDKIAVVTWTDVRQSRVRRIDIGRNSGVQQRFQRRLENKTAKINF
jgi:hypothetical protein